MTRQNSRPAKKKHHKAKQQGITKESPGINLPATITSQFTPSLPLKAQIIEKKNPNNQRKSANSSRSGSIFSSGRCTIGKSNSRDTYAVRITNLVAAQSILTVPVGSRIQLVDAKFINSYLDKSQKEISARTFELISELDGDSDSKTCLKATTATTEKTWVIYPTEFGVKQKNGVTLHRPFLRITV